MYDNGKLSGGVAALLILSIVCCVEQAVQAAQCQVTMKLAGPGLPAEGHTWTNGTGPSDVCVQVGKQYTFEGNCKCGHTSSLSSNFGESDGPEANPSFTHTFAAGEKSTTKDDTWAKTTCSSASSQESKAEFTVVYVAITATGSLYTDPPTKLLYINYNGDLGPKLAGNDTDHYNAWAQGDRSEINPDTWGPNDVPGGTPGGVFSATTTFQYITSPVGCKNIGDIRHKAFAGARTITDDELIEVAQQ